MLRGAMTTTASRPRPRFRALLTRAVARFIYFVMYGWRGLFVLALLLGLTAATAAAGSYTLADLNDALAARARGAEISSADPRVAPHLWRRPLEHWNGVPSAGGRSAIGSQNTPVIAAAAAGDYRWTAALSDLEAREGIFGRELGAPGYYTTHTLVARMVALRDARAAGDEAAAAAITRSLRGVWSYFALAAVATPRTSTYSDLGGTVRRGPGDAGVYLGLTVALVGERWKNGGYTEHDDVGTLLSWAIDWTPRSVYAGNGRQNRGSWWPAVVAALADVDDYRSPTAAAVFGLEDREREVLRAAAAGDVGAARTAATWLEAAGGIGPWYRVTLLRTTEGVEAVFYRSYNGNKPAHAATTVTTAGAWSTAAPSTRCCGANQALEVWRDGGRIFARSRDGATVSIEEIGGALVYQVDIEGAAVGFTARPTLPPRFDRPPLFLRGPEGLPHSPGP